MLRSNEDQMIEQVLSDQGLTEENCLHGLSEQQRRVWVYYAILGKTEKEILESLFCGRKNATPSMVRGVLDEARLRILVNLLRDWELMDEISSMPQLKNNIAALITRVEQHRNRGKKKCQK